MHNNRAALVLDTRIKAPLRVVGCMHVCAAFERGSMLNGFVVSVRRGRSHDKYENIISETIIHQAALFVFVFVCMTYKVNMVCAY